MGSTGRAVLHAIPLCVLILALDYFWFVHTDRNIVFLYYHDMGPRVPDTSPFSFVTGSRYWMTGLVANGFVFLAYGLYTFIRSRFNKAFKAPDWFLVFFISSPILIAVTLFITMTMNEPVLPFRYAAKVAAANLAGLLLALFSARSARRKPGQIMLLGIDGLVIGFLMNVSTWFEQAATMPAWRFALMLKIFAICLVLILLNSVFYVRKRISLKTGELFAISCSFAFLFGAMFHYVFGTDGHFYISNSDNFFVRSPVTQLLIWILAYLFAHLICRIRILLMGDIRKC